MFREALDYPTRPTEGGRAVILGGLTLIVVAAFVAITGLDTPYAYFAAFGILPWLLVRGYYVRVVRTTIGRDRPTPPRFDDVRRLLVDGAKAVIISITYLLPGSLVLGPLVVIQVFGTDLSTLLADRGVSEMLAIATVSIAGILAIGAFMSLLGALYVLPVAVARFAHSGDLRSAFDLRTVVSGGMTEDYALAWGISFALQLFLVPLAFLLRIVLIGFFLEFFVASAVRYCYGQGVGAALDLEPVPAAHERSDPNGWNLRPAVRRLDGDTDEPTRERNDDSSEALRPAITRIGIDSRIDWTDR